MTPIERACRALAELHGRDPDEPILLTDRLIWQDFEPQVRVVAAAFREPSDVMVDAAVSSTVLVWDEDRDSAREFKTEFTAAIDAMLGEGR